MGRHHLILCLFMLAAKVSVGLLTGSKSLMAAGLFSLQVALSATILMVGSRREEKLIRRGIAAPAGKQRFLVAGAMGVVIFLGVAALGIEVLHNLLYHRQLAPSPSALGMALVCAVISMVMDRSAGHAARQADTPLSRDHAAHVRSDLLVSAAVAGSVVAGQFGVIVADFIVAVTATAYLVLHAGRVLRAAAWGLMDASISAANLARVVAAARRVDAVSGILKARGVDSGRGVSISLVLGLPAEMTIAEAEKLRECVVANIRKKEPYVGEIGYVMVGYRVSGGVEA